MPRTKKKEPAEYLDAVLGVRVRKEERAAITDQARASRFASPSAWARHVLVAALADASREKAA